MSIREELERRLTQISGLVRHRARRGRGYSYFVADREIAHFHGDQRMDVRLTREKIRKRISERPFDHRVRTRGPSADWVAVRILELHDLRMAVALVKEAMQVDSLLNEK